jgi:hypothetical protein
MWPFVAPMMGSPRMSSAMKGASPADGRRGRNTAKIVPFATKQPPQPGTVVRYVSHLCAKFDTWRINGISPTINELKPPYQPNNNEFEGS